MELTLFTLNWLDVISVAVTFIVILLVQVLNVYLHILTDSDDKAKSIDVVDRASVKEIPILESRDSPPTTITPPKTPTTPTNGKLEKQASLLDNDR